MAADNQIGSSDWSAPGRHAFAVTPSDTELSYVFRALYVGGTGNVVITTLGSGNVASADVTFNNVPAGTILPICGKFVKAATTATNIVALF